MSTSSVTLDPMDIAIALDRLAEIGWRKHTHDQNSPTLFCITNADETNFLWLAYQKGHGGEDRIIVTRYGRNSDSEVYEALGMISEYSAVFNRILFGEDHYLEEN